MGRGHPDRRPRRPAERVGAALVFNTSDQERTTWEQPYEGCRTGTAEPTTYGNGVVTAHASFPALRYAPDQALANLDKLRSNFDADGPGRFYDAVAAGSGEVSREYLSLDQGMIVAALATPSTATRCATTSAAARCARRSARSWPRRSSPRGDADLA